MNLEIKTDEEMQNLGASLTQVLEKNDVVYLVGTLGAGKTTLVRGFARGLSYKGRITSPTFTLMNIYESDPPIYHFDFYRLEGGDLRDLGLEDYLEREGISFIEWPPSESKELPEEALVIEIHLTDEDYELARQVHISADGRRYEEKIERLMQIVNSGVR